MRVEIFSMMAAISGTPHGTTWDGELNISADDGMDVALERVFRTLNAVEDGDREQLFKMGYDLPSLSVGDFVTLHLPDQGPSGPRTQPVTWQVQGVGFVQVTKNPDYAMRNF